MHRFDEMYGMSLQAASVRPHYHAYAQWLQQQAHSTLQLRQSEAEAFFRRVGITFTVYGEQDASAAGVERLIPFDVIPRIIPAQEWLHLQQGLVQRVQALNRFIADIYGAQDIVRAGVVPRDLIEGNVQYRPQMRGVPVPGDIYAHIAGIDVVCAPDAQGMCSTTCSKTTSECLPGCRTCWKTAE